LSAVDNRLIISGASFYLSASIIVVIRSYFVSGIEDEPNETFAVCFHSLISHYCETAKDLILIVRSSSSVLEKEPNKTIAFIPLFLFSQDDRMISVFSFVSCETAQGRKDCSRSFVSFLARRLKGERIAFVRSVLVRRKTKRESWTMKLDSLVE